METLTDREVREKLVSRGAGSLTDCELLGLILGESKGGHNSTEIAGRVLDAYEGSLLTMARSDMTRLRMTEGIGMKRASILTAVFELASRLRRQEASIPTTIRTRDDVTAIFFPLLAGLRHEEMWALYLSSANGVIEKTRVSQGGVKSLIVDYKLIIKRAIEVLASSLIIVHNHPSGIAVPSAEDIEITNRISDAAALFDIMLVDHLIITDGASYSFHQSGLMK